MTRGWVGEADEEGGWEGKGRGMRTSDGEGRREEEAGELVGR